MQLFITSFDVSNETLMLRVPWRGGWLITPGEPGILSYYYCSNKTILLSNSFLL